MIVIFAILGVLRFAFAGRSSFAAPRANTDRVKVIEQLIGRIVVIVAARVGNVLLERKNLAPSVEHVLALVFRSSNDSTVFLRLKEDGLEMNSFESLGREKSAAGSGCIRRSDCGERGVPTLRSAVNFSLTGAVVMESRCNEASKRFDCFAEDFRSDTLSFQLGIVGQVDVIFDRSSYAGLVFAFAVGLSSGELNEFK